MIQRDFCRSEGPKAVRLSHGDFRFVVQAFDDTARELLARMEVVEDQFPMCAHGASEFLHRLDA